MYFDIFLATHRYFMSPQDLLSRLQDMYMSVPLTTRFGKTYKHLRSQLHHIRLRFDLSPLLPHLSRHTLTSHHITLARTHTHAHTWWCDVHRVVNLLKKWLETFFSDFADPALVKDLEAFEKLMSGLGGKSLHWQAIIRIHRVLSPRLLIVFHDATLTLTPARARAIIGQSAAEAGSSGEERDGREGRA
jgi:hypothetical protein